VATFVVIEFSLKPKIVVRPDLSGFSKPDAWLSSHGAPVATCAVMHQQHIFYALWGCERSLEGMHSRFTLKKQHLPMK
jgi:hypothetical protein